MADTARTRAFLLGTDFIDNTSGLITAQMLRDFVVSVIGPPTALSPTTGAVTWDLSVNPCASITLTGNATITVTNGEDGMSYRLAVVQGGAGSFTPTFSGVTFSGVPAWATVVGASNRVYIDMVGTTRMADVI
jgi:hypothetical protein